jgi:hypothetical protein
VLAERGGLHEQDYVDHLKASGLLVTAVDGVGVNSSVVTQTLEAMKGGEQVIVQAALQAGHWSGRADILRRVEKPSDRVTSYPQQFRPFTTIGPKNTQCGSSGPAYRNWYGMLLPGGTWERPTAARRCLCARVRPPAPLSPKGTLVTSRMEVRSALGPAITRAGGIKPKEDA